ncbi:MAG: hypothetical protein ACE1ZX_03150 [Acidimicrobiia bacterium]
MELASRKRLMVFSGSGNEPLAEEVASILGVQLGGPPSLHWAAS